MVAKKKKKTRAATFDLTLSFFVMLGLANREEDNTHVYIPGREKQVFEKVNYDSSLSGQMEKDWIQKREKKDSTDQLPSSSICLK